MDMLLQSNPFITCLDMPRNRIQRQYNHDPRYFKKFVLKSIFIKFTEFILGYNCFIYVVQFFLNFSPTHIKEQEIPTFHYLLFSECKMYMLNTAIIFSWCPPAMLLSKPHSIPSKPAPSHTAHIICAKFKKGSIDIPRFQIHSCSGPQVFVVRGLENMFPSTLPLSLFFSCLFFQQPLLLTLIVQRAWEIGYMQPCIKCQGKSATHFVYF